MRGPGIALLWIALSGCLAVAAPTSPGPAKSQGKGPPAHAPAHGYRAKTAQGVEIVFDSGIGVYVVVAVPGQYWLDDRYYRKANGGWQVSVGAQGPWLACRVGDLPIGLQRQAESPGKSKKPK